jgi:ribonuclease HI
MRTVNFITINTDASFHPKHKVGGYAFYIVCDYFKIMKSGMIKSKVSNSWRAEMMALGNAFYCLSKQPELPKVKNKIIVNTDCQHNINRLECSIKRTELTRRVHGLKETVRQKVGLSNHKMVEMRHVKAHQEVVDAKTWVNNWCDKESKKWMRVACEIKTGKPYNELRK